METNETNVLPNYDMSDNPTNCCPRFDPEPWDDLEVRFEEKLFVKATTRSVFHIPLNMGSMMKMTTQMLRDADAVGEGGFLMLSHDPSPWKGEHYFAVTKEIPGAEMVRLSGTYLTKTFEGPFKDVQKWMGQIHEYADAKGKKVEKVYLFYTTCPKCAKHYGKNYVVGFAQAA